MPGCYVYKQTILEVIELYTFKQIWTEIGSLVFSQDAERETDKGPEMDDPVVASKVMTDILHLGMAVMAGSKYIACSGCSNLVKFSFAVGSAMFSHTCLQESAASATTVVGTAVRLHVDEILLAHQRFCDKAHIFSN